MKVKTSELSDKALDWAVAKADGAEVEASGDPSELFIEWPNNFMYLSFFNPSTDDAQGGPIIDREHVSTTWGISSYPTIAGCWAAHIPGGNGKLLYAPTRLVAAMRCFVASKLGDEVDVPEELLR